MKDYVELIQSVATLLWPLFAFTVLFTFKTQIASLLERLRKGKVFGQEIELNDSLNRLNESAVAVAEEIASLPQTSIKSFPNLEENNSDIKQILHETARSPRAALLMLASDLEYEVRQLLASVGKLNNSRYVPLSQSIKMLGKHFGGLPEDISSSLNLFLDARNKLIHGNEAMPEDILRAIDSGVTILKALKSITREINVVYHSGVTIFQDPLCERPYLNVKGIILQTQLPNTEEKVFRIFPSTRAHFQTGKRVAWEWSYDLTWGPAWYKDPDTGEIKIAWSSSAEFVGRHLDDV